MRRFIVVALVALTVASTVVAPGAAAARSRAVGSFTATLDFGSLTLRDVGPQACRLTVDGVLAFTGTIDGTAAGTTDALIAAPCAAVATTPPGTFADGFVFRGRFAGRIDGAATSAALTYAGVTRPGGAIRAGMTMGAGAIALLDVDAVVGVGGTYAGFARAA